MVPAIQRMGHHTQIAGQGPSVPQLSTPRKANLRRRRRVGFQSTLDRPHFRAEHSVRQNVWTIGGAGNPSAPAEQFHFVSRSFLGDGVFSAKLEKFERALIMLRAAYTSRRQRPRRTPAIRDFWLMPMVHCYFAGARATEKPFESVKLESAARRNGSSSLELTTPSVAMLPMME